MENNNNQIYLTKEGFQALEERLAYLKGVVRVDVAHKIEIAKSFGDINENAEYDSVREEETEVELEIAQIENSLRNAQIINKNKIDTSKVNVGSTVVVHNFSCNEEQTFKIMGSFESDPTNGSISNESPIGKALLGAKKGDIVEVLTPRNTIKYQIKAIRC